MFEEFIKELDEALKKEGVEKREEIVRGYRERFSELSASGKSEFEIIVFFGEPREIAAKSAHPEVEISAEEKLLKNPLIVEINGDKDEASDESPLPAETAADTGISEERRELSGLGFFAAKKGKAYSKAEIICTDIFYYGLMSAVEAVGLILLFGLSALAFGAACPWLVKSFTEFDTAGARTGAFFMTLFVIALCVLFVYLGIRLIKAFIVFSKEYFAERAEKVANSK